MAPALDERKVPAAVLRYALAPACVLAAVLLHLSPAAPLLPAAAAFVFAVLCAAWFGGPGPGLLTAALGAAVLPQLVAVSYPLLGGVLDLPRFLAFSAIGFTVGWGSFRRAAKLREQERLATRTNAHRMNMADVNGMDVAVAGPAAAVFRRVLGVGIKVS
jgi:hypothetical protein